MDLNEAIQRAWNGHVVLFTGAGWLSAIANSASDINRQMIAFINGVMLSEQI
jgi:hypothetical protein